MNKEKYIDHTLLKSFATKDDILKLCNEANLYKFKSVCVNPVNVELAYELLKGTDVLVCTVIGFPLGANTSEVKAYETTKAITDGASEIDMVINIGAAKSHDYDVVYNDILSVVKAANGVLVKVIIETCYLTDEEKITVCQLAVKAGANYVKTSTGFGPSGATEHDILLMRETVGKDIGVKASGGIKTIDDFTTMVNAGANRIGTSNGIFIMEDNSNDNTNSTY